MYLPTSCVENSITTVLATTYVLTEGERKRMEKTRRHAISHSKHMLTGMIQKLADSKCQVYCIETALIFCNISFESYYDSDSLKTKAGYDIKAMDLKKYGYKLIYIIYKLEHETFCIIARHLTLNKLVVCFRGTSCKTHWSDNFNFTQRELYLPELSELDKVDELDVDSHDIDGMLPPSPSTKSLTSPSSPPSTSAHPTHMYTNPIFSTQPHSDIEMPPPNPHHFERPNMARSKSISMVMNNNKPSMTSSPSTAIRSILCNTPRDAWQRANAKLTRSMYRVFIIVVVVVVFL